MIRRLALCLFYISTTEVLASKNFDSSILFNVMASEYKNTGQQEYYTTQSKGVYVSGDNDKNGYTVGYSKLKTTQESGSYQNDQNQLSASVRFYSPLSENNGSLINRFDVYYLNTDRDWNVDNIKAFSPQVTWLSTEKNRSFNLAYSYSHYASLQNVHQFSPALGSSIGKNNWLQLRAYFTRSSNKMISEGESDKKALEAKLTHSFKGSSSRNKLNYLQLASTVGSRQFFIDPDTAMIYDSGGIQTRSLSAKAKWDISESQSILLSLGNAKYQSYEKEYDSNYAAWSWVLKPNIGKSRLLELP